MFFCSMFSNPELLPLRKTGSVFVKRGPLWRTSGYFSAALESDGQIGYDP